MSRLIPCVLGMHLRFGEYLGGLVKHNHSTCQNAGEVMHTLELASGMAHALRCVPPLLVANECQLNVLRVSNLSTPAGTHSNVDKSLP